MKADHFFDLPQREITMRSYQAKSPMFFQEASLIGAMFTADRKTVENWMPSSAYHPITVSKERVLVAISCIEYKKSDIGSYNEIALAIPVVFGEKAFMGKRFPLHLRALWSSLLRSCDLYIKELPVNTDIAYVGGVDVLNYPKYHADINFRENADHRICTLREKDTLELVLEFELRKFKARKFIGNINVNTWPIIKDRPALAKMVVRPQRIGFSLVPWKTSLRLGKASKASPFAELKLGQPLLSFYAPSYRAILCEPEEK